MPEFDLWSLVGKGGESGLFAILLSVNAVFVKKLVERISETLKKQQEIEVKLTEFMGQFRGLMDQVQDVKLEVRELRKLESDVNLLKALINPKLRQDVVSRATDA